MIAQATKVALSYVGESTHGTTPGSPSMKTLRTIGRALNYKKKTLESQEIFADRNIHDVRHGMESVDGPLAFELSRLTYDDILESLLGGTWTSNVLKVGTTVRTFTFERRFTDVGLYQPMRGCIPNTMELRVQPEQIVGGTVNILGMNPDAPQGSSLGTPSAATTTSPFDAFTGVLQESGSTISVVTGLTLSIDNRRTLTGVVGSKFSPDVFDGQFNLTGSMDVLLENATLFNKFKNETTTSLSLQLNDIDGVNWMKFDLPKIKLLGDDMDPGQEGSVVQNIPFRALFDSVEATSFTISRSSAS